MHEHFLYNVPANILSLTACELAGSHWQVLLAGLVAIHTLEIRAPL